MADARFSVGSLIFLSLMAGCAGSPAEPADYVNANDASSTTPVVFEFALDQAVADFAVLIDIESLTEQANCTIEISMKGAAPTYGPPYLIAASWTDAQGFEYYYVDTDWRLHESYVYADLGLDTRSIQGVRPYDVNMTFPIVIRDNQPFSVMIAARGLEAAGELQPDDAAQDSHFYVRAECDPTTRIDAWMSDRPALLNAETFSGGVALAVPLASLGIDASNRFDFTQAEFVQVVGASFGAVGTMELDHPNGTESWLFGKTDSHLLGPVNSVCTSGGCNLRGEPGTYTVTFTGTSNEQMVRNFATGNEPAKDFVVGIAPFEPIVG